jgi:amino acid adenylation domain-containing protein
MFAMAITHLAEYLERSARALPDRTAVVDPGGFSITYGQLNDRADALAAFLTSRGVQRGDRVGLIVPKGVDSVTALYAIMKAGAAYVPVDPTGPPERARRILSDCRVSAVVVHDTLLGAVPAEEALRAVISVGGDGEQVVGQHHTTAFEDALANAPRGEPLPRAAGDLAYILYTSGSTGMPKGVMLTHENAVSFVEWCSETFHPTDDDRFSSHAPFHFDLSVLDLYLSAKHGSALYLISEELGKDPRSLSQFIAENRLTIWYSTPSILTLLLQFGRLETHDCSALRIVFFAGEVFPVKHLRELQKRWPQPVYYNLYGPTETNVCTFARIPEHIPDDRQTPYPIGFACSHCTPLVLDADGADVASGGEGLLYMSGPSVFQGYWNRPVENGAAFIERDGLRWYNTGDVVVWNPAEGFVYLGRRDRMVKRRGYRIELGEIERALYLHPSVREAAVVAVPHEETGVLIVAFLSSHGDEPLSIIGLKTFCASHLPPYMSPDRFVIRDRLPRTSTDKVDYQALRAPLTGSEVA